MEQDPLTYEKSHIQSASSQFAWEFIDRSALFR